MEVPKTSENFSVAEKSPDKQCSEKPTEVSPPETGISTEKATKEGTKSGKEPGDKYKQFPGEASSPTGDSEVRQPRVRKRVQRWSEVLSKSFAEEQVAKEKALDAQLAKGSGTALGEIPLIESSIRKFKPADLKLLHFSCFGRTGTASEVRSNLRKFNGFPFDSKSAEYTKREMALTRKPVKEVQEALRQLHLEVSGTRLQIVTRLLEFLLKPEASAVKYKGKLPPSKRKSVSGRKSKKVDSEESGSKSGPRSGRKSKKASKKSGEEGSGELEDIPDIEEDEKDEVRGEIEEEAASEKSKNPSDDDYAPWAKKKSKKIASRKHKAPTNVAKDSTCATKRRRTNIIESESEEEKLSDDGETEKDANDDMEKTKSSDAKSREGSDSNDDDDKPLAKVASKSEEGSGEVASTRVETSELSAVPFPSDGELKEKTLELLRMANLNEVSMKVIRQSVAEQYPNLDLSSKKEFLNSVIKEVCVVALREDSAKLGACPISGLNHLDILASTRQ